MALLARLYSRRIVNVNVNIVLAGLLAMGPTALVAHLTHYIPGLKHPAAITGIILLSDAVFDVLIYYVLHWLANHYPRKRRGHLSGVDLSFIRDASLVQFERAMLIPVFYGVTAGLSWWLLHHKIAGREWTTVIALFSGIMTTRVVHTIWMLRQDRLRQRAVTAAGVPLAQGGPGESPPPVEPSPAGPRTAERAAASRP
jgi:hypothetical protein